MRYDTVSLGTSSIELFGSRQKLGNDYLKRGDAAAVGIYGNSPEEAVYVGTLADARDQPPEGGKKYTQHFAANALLRGRFNIILR